jgi:GNAT superfamily N-acetyltransferase
VAYLEGWFVAPKARGRGVGRALIAARSSGGAPGVVVSLRRTRRQTTRSAAPLTARLVLPRLALCGASGRISRVSSQAALATVKGEGERWCT